MGNDHAKIVGDTGKNKQKDASAIPQVLNIKKYNKIAVIGRGGFGKVYLMKNRYGKSRAKKIVNYSH